MLFDCRFPRFAPVSISAAQIPRARWARRAIAVCGLMLAGACMQSTKDPVAPVTEPPAISSVRISPNVAALAVGATLQFTVAGTLTDGTATTPTVAYSADGGTISASGLYAAGTVPGTYRVIATATSIVKADTSFVTISAPIATLVNVVLLPATITLAQGATQQFAVSGSWSDGSTNVPSVTYVATGGTVTSGGLYTAGTVAGNFTVIATQQGGTKADTSAVIVAGVAPPPSNRWVTGYYVGYQRDLYPESTIDFANLTHIVVGAIEPTMTGGVTSDLWIDDVAGPLVAKTISTRAHAANRKALLMLGGAGYRANLLSATSPANMSKFVNNLLSTLTTLGFDGLDIDWEPLEVADQLIVLDLLTRLRAARPNILLTMPVTWINPNWQNVSPWYAQAALQVDQMNIMSYQMADNWPSWTSWHSAALFGGTGEHPSSIESTVAAYKVAGIPPEKIGIGLGAYGSCWRGTNTMSQPLSATAGVYASDNTMSYTHIMSAYFNASAYKWDATARAGYLSYNAPTGPEQCTMVSYEDERSIAEKGAYVKANSLGGAIVWTIGQGHLPNAAAGQRDPLLTAAYNAIVR